MPFSYGIGSGNKKQDDDDDLFSEIGFSGGASVDPGEGADYDEAQETEGPSGEAPGPELGDDGSVTIGVGNNNGFDGDVAAPPTASVTPGEGADYSDPATFNTGDNDADAIDQDFGADEEQSDLDALTEQFLTEQLQGGIGDVDTAEEEALAQLLLEQGAQGNILDRRASMGRSGFGSSGALYAMEGDINRAAGRDSLAARLGIRDREEAEARDAAQAAIGLDIDARNAANEEAILQAQLDALEQLTGTETGAGTAADIGSASDEVDHEAGGVLGDVGRLPGQAWEWLVGKGRR